LTPFRTTIRTTRRPPCTCLHGEGQSTSRAANRWLCAWGGVPSASWVSLVDATPCTSHSAWSAGRTGSRRRDRRRSYAGRVARGDRGIASVNTGW
jgi:hypothetical protein